MKTGFIPISIEEFVKSTIEHNPKENLKELRQGLLSALQDYKEGVTCHCGNEIWVAGSAIVGNGCFTCITGEAYPDDDYEIKEALAPFYQVLKTQEQGQRSSQEILKESDFIGSFEAKEDLSVTYKRDIAKGLKAKTES